MTLKVPTFNIIEKLENIIIGLPIFLKTLIVIILIYVVTIKVFFGGFV